jgi:hypothetical protein
MTEITLNFKYSEEEYKEAIRNYYAHAFRTKVDSIISVLVIIAGILCWVYLGYSIVYLLLICVGILLLLLILFVTCIQPGMFFHRQPKLRDEYVLNFNESGIDFKTEHVTAPRHKWRGFMAPVAPGLDIHRGRIVAGVDF